MDLTRKNKIVIVSIALVVSFAVGRYSTPEKVKVETKVVTVEKRVEVKTVDSKDNDHKKTVVQEVDKPSGEKDITTIVTDDRSNDTKVDDSMTKNVTNIDYSEKQTVRGDSKVTIAAMVGVNVTNVQSGFVWGVNAYKPILGPIGIGIFGLNNGIAGASVGISF